MHAGAVMLPTMVFLGLSWRYLQLGEFEASQSVFGDTGDGFFNLWILEHLRMNLFQGWNALSDARMLYPAEGTFWWSDNLIVLSPPYLLARAFGFSVLEAGTWTNLFWAFAMFWASAWLFSEVRMSVVRPLPTFGILGNSLPFWLAAVAALIPARIYGLQHFQSHALVLWVGLAVCGIRYLRVRSTPALVGMAVCWSCTMASAPYYAVLGFFSVGVCGLTLLSDPETNWKRFWLCQVPWAGLALLPVLPIVWAYMQVETREFAQEELLRRSWTFAHWLPPLNGARPHGFPGAWLLPAVCLLCSGCIRVIPWRQFRSLPWKPVLWLLIPAGLTLLKIKELYPVTAWVRLGVSLAMIGMVIRLLRKKGSVSSRVVFNCSLLLLLIAGTAMGPGTFFGEEAMDPSVWGVSAALIPSYRGMRELIRFAPAASVILLAVGYAAALWLRPGCRSWCWNAALVLVIAVGLVDPWRPVAERKEVASFDLTPAQAEFFSTLEGVMVEIPAAPFHRNPSAMLRWQPFRRLRLVNGYSGKSTPEFADVISAENHVGRASQEQVQASLAAGADWMCIRRAWVGDADEQALSDRYPVLYQDEAFLLVRIRPEDP